MRPIYGALISLPRRRQLNDVQHYDEDVASAKMAKRCQNNKKFSGFDKNCFNTILDCVKHNFYKNYGKFRKYIFILQL